MPQLRLRFAHLRGLGQVRVQRVLVYASSLKRESKARHSSFEATQQKGGKLALSAGTDWTRLSAFKKRFAPGFCQKSLVRVSLSTTAFLLAEQVQM
jgi:hypothetical protein